MPLHSRECHVVERRRSVEGIGCPRARREGFAWRNPIVPQGTESARASWWALFSLLWGKFEPGLSFPTPFLRQSRGTW